MTKHCRKSRSFALGLHWKTCTNKRGELGICIGHRHTPLTDDTPRSINWRLCWSVIVVLPSFITRLPGGAIDDISRRLEGWVFFLASETPKKYISAEAPSCVFAHIYSILHFSIYQSGSCCMR